MPKADLEEPNLSVIAFDQRCKRLAIRFAAAVDLTTGDVAFASQFSATGAAMTLNGRASEMIDRNRGRPHPVVPISRIRDDVWIWTGYRETWQKQGSEQNVRFVDAGFTLHVGRLGEVHKPQILRSEWVGRRSNAFVDLAGHPHWQLDVLESARRTMRAPAPARFEEAAVAEIREFGEGAARGPGEKADELLFALTMEDMHLASAASWWLPVNVSVAHLPTKVDELDRWILGCIAYLRQEAGRCRIASVAA